MTITFIFCFADSTNLTLKSFFTQYKKGQIEIKQCKQSFLILVKSERCKVTDRLIMTYSNFLNIVSQVVNMSKQTP